MLGFYFEGRYYRFRRLQFGLNTAPELCELMLSVVSWKLNQLGVKHVRYCDDILIIGSTAVACSNMTDTAIHELDLFGFAVSHAKTIRCVQVIDFLGIQLNSLDGTLSCPPHRVAELLELLATAAVHETTHVVRFILSLIGKLSFAAQVLPGARPFFRSLIDATRGKNRREFVQLSPDTLTDISRPSVNVERSPTLAIISASHRHRYRCVPSRLGRFGALLPSFYNPPTTASSWLRHRRPLVPFTSDPLFIRHWLGRAICCPLFGGSSRCGSTKLLDHPPRRQSS